MSPDESARAGQELGDGREICGRCGATMHTYADRCSADLAERCPGFEAVEAACRAAPTPTPEYYCAARPEWDALGARVQTVLRQGLAPLAPPKDAPEIAFRQYASLRVAVLLSFILIDLAAIAPRETTVEALLAELRRFVDAYARHPENRKQLELLIRKEEGHG